MGKLASHGQARVAGAVALGPAMTQPNRRKRGLDRVGRSQVGPVEWHVVLPQVRRTK